MKAPVLSGAFSWMERIACEVKRGRASRAETVAKHIHDVTNSTEPFSASITPFELPEQMRVLAEKSVSQARDSYAKFKDLAESHNGNIEAVFTTARKGASEYSAKLMEMMKSDTTTTLDFAQELLRIKSPSEAVELWTCHARKQFEAFSAQAKELGELSQRVGRAEDISGQFAVKTKSVIKSKPKTRTISPARS